MLYLYIRLYTHIYLHGLWLLLLCLAGCAKDKANPPLSDAEKQLLGKWYLQRRWIPSCLCTVVPNITM